MTRKFAFITCILLAPLIASCDMRSGIARQEMEKFAPSPTPAISPIPTATTIDPADIAKVDTSVEGGSISIDAYKEERSASCAKFERIRVNGDGNQITVKGVCRQVMINGDANKVLIDAAAEIVFNGTGNSVHFSRFVNGKQPVVVENRPGNIIEKVSAGTATNQVGKRNIVE